MVGKGTIRRRRGWRLVMAAVAGVWTCAGCESPAPDGPSTGRPAAVQPSDTAKAETHVVKLAKTDHIALLEHCLKRNEGRFRSYTCTLIKQERLRGKLSKEQWVRVKFRQEPFSVAMAWRKNPPAGDRILYVQGRYGGKMLVRPTGRLARFLAGKTVKRDPHGKEAKKNSLRTVDQFGFKNSLQALLKFYRLGKTEGVLKEEFGKYAEVYGRSAVVLIRYLPDSPKYPSYKTLIYLDVKHLVPVCVEGYDSAGRLICRYVYRDVKPDAGLTAKDFLPEANGLVPPK